MFPTRFAGVEVLTKAKANARYGLPIGGAFSLNVPQLEPSLFVKRTPRFRLSSLPHYGKANLIRRFETDRGDRETFYVACREGQLKVLDALVLKPGPK